MNSPVDFGSAHSLFATHHHYSRPFPSHQTRKTPPTPSNASTSPCLIRTILLGYYNLTVSRLYATIPHVPSTPRRPGPRPAAHCAGIALPNRVSVFRTPRSPICQCFSSAPRCSLTEQKTSKTRASNPFVLRKIQRLISATPFNSYACRFRGVFSPPLFLRSNFADPSFRDHVYFRYNLPALAPSGLSMPCGCSSRTGFEVSG
jgi:hypothetical protein